MGQCAAPGGFRRNVSLGSNRPLLRSTGRAGSTVDGGIPFDASTILHRKKKK